MFRKACPSTKGCLVNYKFDQICTLKFEDLGSSVLMPVSRKRHLPMAPKRLPTSEKSQFFALWQQSASHLFDI